MILAALLACTPDPSGPDASELPFGRVEVSRNERMVLERVFALTFRELTAVTLRCTAPSDPLEDHRLSWLGVEGELRLYGLLAEHRYECELRDSADRLRWSGAFTTDPLPEGFPELAVSGDREAAHSDEGYTLFTHWNLGRDLPDIQRLIVVDGDGRVRWYLDAEDATTGGLAGAMLPDGRVIVGGGQGSPPSIRNLSGEILFRVPPSEEVDPGYHHEALLTSEGWLVSLQGITNRAGDETFDGFRIEAWDPQRGERVWSFDTQPWVDAGVLPPGGPGDHDPYHANAVSFVDEPPLDGVWVSLRGLGLLMRLDRETAEITGTFGPDQGIGLVDLDGAPVSRRGWFWGQHAPEIRGDTFLVYDNGGSRPGARQYSRVAKYRWSGAGDAVLLWDWSELDWFERNFGSAVSMADDHVLVGTGHCTDCFPPGDTAWILELDPVRGEVVWRFDLTTDRHSIYRAQPIDGCAPFANVRYCPDLAVGAP